VSSTVTLRLNALGQVQTVNLMQDANLPNSERVSGTITAVSTGTITIGTYDLTLASTIDVTYFGATSLTNSVTSGEIAQAWLNSSGQVTRLSIGAPSSGQDHSGNGNHHDH
jgi:hypothetical protein